MKGKKQMNLKRIKLPWNLYKPEMYLGTIYISNFGLIRLQIWPPASWENQQSDITPDLIVSNMYLLKMSGVFDLTYFQCRH
jgi:hypothetical protein